MKLYGHELGTDAVKPLRLEEVTVAADVRALSLLAEILVFVADRMDKDGSSFGHEHFEDFSGTAPSEPSFDVTSPVVCSDSTPTG